MRPRTAATRGSDAADQDLPDPEQRRVDAAVPEEEALELVLARDVEVGEVLDRDEVQHRRDEHAEQVAQPVRAPRRPAPVRSMLQAAISTSTKTARPKENDMMMNSGASSALLQGSRATRKPKIDPVPVVSTRRQTNASRPARLL